MKKYQCHKIVEAEPMNAYDFTEKTGKFTPGDDGYKVKYSDGYISWSPKEVFEEGYTEIK